MASYEFNSDHDGDSSTGSEATQFATGDAPTRRGVLRTLGAATAAGSFVVGGVGTAAASHKGECEGGYVDGDEIIINESNGSTVEYWIVTENGSWWDCYPDTLESSDQKSTKVVNGTVNDGEDKWLLSGGGIVDIEFDDKDGDGSVSMDVNLGHDHCAADYSKYAPVEIDGQKHKKARYYFCMTDEVERGDNLESNDSRIWGTCAEGYIYDGIDQWDAYGRFQRVSVDTNGNYVEISRMPYYEEC